MTTYAKLLRDPRWKAARAEILELDGNACSKCGASGKVLHVHHSRYIAGLMPWEYPPGLLETLCAGCHAAEHGKIPPRTGWTLLDVEDLGEPSSNCELCDTEIRYVFLIQHPQWGFLNVGTVCCDDLTGTAEACETERRMKRRRRFIESPRWKRVRRGTAIKLNGIRVYVLPWGNGYRVRMAGNGSSVLGARVYESEPQARGVAFDTIVTGVAGRFLTQTAQQNGFL